MIYTVFGGILVFAGFYLIAKKIASAKNGISITAELVGFATEKDAQYPLFKFTYEGQEISMTGGMPVSNPSKYKYSVGDSVSIKYSPKNTRYVDVVGENSDLLYAAGSIVLGAILIVASIMK